MPYAEMKRRLSPMDASFLYLERDNMPMHVGAVQTFEGRLNTRQFAKMLSEKLPLVPRYLQRVVPAPLNLGHPTWEFDPDFDINNHIFEVKLSKPGSIDQLHRVAERLMEEPLDRKKPLWDLHVVHGLEGNRTGLVSRVHHCMVDGIAGVALMFVLLDTAPDTPKYKGEKLEPPPMPPNMLRAYEALWDSAIDGLEHWTRLINEVQTYGAKNGHDKGHMIPALKEWSSTMGGLLSPIKRMPFNQPFSGGRRLAFGEFPFAEARAIRKALGGTFNDVCLTMLAGAMRCYLEDHDFPATREDLRVMMPASLRKEDARGQLGNEISFVPVHVPLDRSDPVERLQAIHQITEVIKHERVADSIGLMFKVLQGTQATFQKAFIDASVSPTGQSVLSALSQVPPLHCICTNIPGPQIPLYTLGHRLLSHHALVPVALEMGITIAITTYDQRMYVTLIADTNCAPDIDKLLAYMREEFEELRHRAEVQEREPVDIPPVTIRRAKSVPRKQAPARPAARSARHRH